MSVAKPSMTLDTRGYLCPIPVVRANEAIAKVGVGEVIEVLATDPGSKSDFRAWTRTKGYTLLSITEEGQSPRVFRFHIRREK